MERAGEEQVEIRWREQVWVVKTKCLFACKFHTESREV